MEGRSQLDASRSAGSCKLVALLAVTAALLCGASALAQGPAEPADAARLAAARAAFNAEKWEETARLAQGPATESFEFDLLAGLAYARLQRWKEAREALEAGRRKAPRDSRFPVELAGVAYKEHDFETAKTELRAALRLNPQDAYAREFLGTIYFLEGNLDAALKYWNTLEKPRLRSVTLKPEPVLRRDLLAKAVTFNAPQVLTRESLRDSTARLDNLGVFPHQRVELAASSSGEYDATIHVSERNGWGDSRLEGILSLLAGVPYQTVYPEYYNLDRAAVNFASLARWDDQKRRYSAALSAPAFRDPALRFEVYFDARNENWNLSSTFSGAAVPLTNLNMRRIAGGAKFRAVMNGDWNWSAGVEVAHRDFGNLQGQSAAAPPFFTESNSVAAWLGAKRSLLRIPERRITLDSTAEVRAGRNFAAPLGPFATARGGLRAHWLPRATGDDYEMQTQLRAGATAGSVPLDELFQLGVERDNDLWLRGHAGTADGRKGAAPLGRRYLLANWEMDKNIYSGAFFGIKLGPFFDTGAIADSSGFFGSHGWQWDTGAQCKVRILGSLTVVLSYGRDLRGGRNTYFGTVLR